MEKRHPLEQSLDLTTHPRTLIQDAHDLRRIIAKTELERRRAPPRSKWAPGSWQKAAAYNATKPEVRSPILVGGDSIIQTPEDLRDLLQLPSVPPLIIPHSNNRDNSLPVSDEKENDPQKETLEICDVGQRQWLDIQKVTEGDMVVVWFHGVRRYAWLARSKKTEDQSTQSKTQVDAT